MKSRNVSSNRDEFVCTFILTYSLKIRALLIGRNGCIMILHFTNLSLFKRLQVPRFIFSFLIKQRCYFSQTLSPFEARKSHIMFSRFTERNILTFSGITACHYLKKVYISEYYVCLRWLVWRPYWTHIVNAEKQCSTDNAIFSLHRLNEKQRKFNQEINFVYCGDTVNLVWIYGT